MARTITNIYRNNPSHDAIGILESRSKLYRNGPHYLAAIRNPAYIKITFSGKGGTATIPEHKDKFEDIYSNTAGLKTYPTLERVTIESGAGSVGPVESVTWSIKCYNKSDFTRLEKIICIYGTEVSVHFGYPLHVNTDQQSIKINKFYIAAFEFNTDSNGNYIIAGKAIKATESTKKLEANAGIKSSGLRYKSGNKTFKVIGLTELMTYDAQHNGEKAIDEVNLNGVDGVIYSSFKDHAPKKSTSSGACVIYKSGHTTIFSGKITKWWQGVREIFGETSSVESSVNIVYYTMQYIVGRLIMGQLMPYYAKSITDSKFNEVEIKFDPKLSLSYIDPNIISGIPTQVVLAGCGKGNYKGTHGAGEELGINFENVTGASDLIKSVVKSSDVEIIDPSKILIERSVIYAALEAASHLQKAKSDKIDIKADEEETINLMEFLRKIFQSVKEATGGSICLGFAQDPDNSNTLLIVDENNGYVGEEFKCTVFDGIDGDGSTRTLNVACRAGSDEMAVSIMSGQSNQGDPVHNISGEMPKISSTRAANYTKAIGDKKELVFSPGSLIESRFDPVQESALTSVMNSFRLNKKDSFARKYALPMYSGLEMNITLDGVYGFKLGNAIACTHLTPNWFNNKSYFMVRQVTHEFQGSDWSTTLSGTISYYENIKYKYL